MQVYLVGGAVRDTLLGLPIKEKDWVVIGATPEEMIAQGYQAVGKDFPVFLHPKTHEEYALARTERKVGKGYKGFTFHATPDVTLEEDLKRRDLTINAMAQGPNGELIDPYGGQTDLQNKILRHVSSAFQEDPVRILRLARFNAKLPDFTVHPETLELMRNMVKAGEVNALVAERVWQELARALVNPQPVLFFKALAACGALAILFPLIDMNSAGMHALKRAAAITAAGPIRCAALLHDVAKSDIKDLCRRYRIPNEYLDLALLVARQLGALQGMENINAAQLLNFILAVDALRRPQRFQDFLIAATASDPDLKNTAMIEKIAQALSAVKSVDTTPLQDQHLKGADFAKALKKLRLAAIETIS